MDPHPIDLDLAKLPIMASAEERLAVIWLHYSSATGGSVSDPPTAEERRAVHEWLRSLHRGDDGDSAPVLMVKQMRLRQLVALSSKEKANFLAQQACGACEVVPDADGAFGRHFPIEVDPWSAQADHVQNKHLKDAVTAMLRNHYRGTQIEGLPLCVTVVSLVPQSHRRKDGDNLVKGLLDSLESVVYANDVQIQCLTSRRVEYAGTSGLYLVQVRAVRPWGDDTVWDDPTSPIVRWGAPIVADSPP